MKSLITCILLSLPFLVTAQQSDSLAYVRESDSLNFGKAVRLFEAEKYGSALMLINPLIIASEKRPDYYSLRGDIYVRIGDADAALADYNTAILFGPHELLSYMRRANLYYELHMPDEGIQDCDSAMKYAQNDTTKYQVLCYRAALRSHKRDFEGAYDDYMRAFTFDSTSLNALSGLGIVLDDLHREKDAIMYLEKAIRLYPGEAGLFVNRGMRYLDVEDCTNAWRMFNRALELSPQNALGLNNRGYVLYQMNDLANALKDIDSSLELRPTNSYAYRNRALVHIAMKQKDKACEDLKEAIKQGFSARYGDEVEKLIYANCK